MGMPYRLLARRESNTGVVSVIDDSERKMRVMKVDHSLLGGYYWDDQNGSIFGIFHVHEAVRLARPNGKRFLQIGLGIGIVASAMQKHGLHVEAIELDPAVAELAINYFALRNESIHVADGIEWTSRYNGAPFDLVVHDVFTGGAVPAALFEMEFFNDVKRIMSGSSILAVNFVGSVDDKGANDTRIVLNTLKHVFNHVRTFVDEHDGDMHNIVFFASDTAISFREAISEDFLRSAIRQDMLATFQRREVTINVPANTPIARKGHNPIGAMQRDSAREHWHVMRSLFGAREFWLRFI